VIRYDGGEVFIVSKNGAIISADLGSSSNHSNEVTVLSLWIVYKALKTVVEKVSLKLANRQGSVGPKLLRKRLQMAKGNGFNIIELYTMESMRQRHVTIGQLMIRARKSFLFSITIYKVLCILLRTLK